MIDGSPFLLFMEKERRKHSMSDDLYSKDHIAELYRACSVPVQLYHAYDLQLTDYDSVNRSRIARFSHMAKAVILFHMNDEEYEELQKSMEGHIIQARIQLAEDRRFVRTIYDPELINEIKKHIDHGVNSNDTVHSES